jgi:hypothetical protein
MKLKLAAAAVGLALSGTVMADSASVSQYGTDNFAFVDQTNSGAYASVYQSGDRNHAGSSYVWDGVTYYFGGIQQTNVSSGYAGLFQQGNDNNGSIYQYQGSNMQAQIQQGGWYWDGEARQSTYYGSANNNSAYVSQYFSDNVIASIQQFGDSNYAGVYQGYGTGNNAAIVQIGNNHAAGTYQTGTNNTVRIVQR